MFRIVFLFIFMALPIYIGFQALSRHSDHLVLNPYLKAGSPLYGSTYFHFQWQIRPFIGINRTPIISFGKT